MGSQAMLFSVFLLGVLSFSVCIENGENSEKSNRMVSATSHIELEFMTKILNMSTFQNWVILLFQTVSLHIAWSYYDQRWILHWKSKGRTWQAMVILCCKPNFWPMNTNFSNVCNMFSRTMIIVLATLIIIWTYYDHTYGDYFVPWSYFNIVGLLFPNMGSIWDPRTKLSLFNISTILCSEKTWFFCLKNFALGHPWLLLKFPIHSLLSQVFDTFSLCRHFFWWSKIAFRGVAIVEVIQWTVNWLLAWSAAHKTPL